MTDEVFKTLGQLEATVKAAHERIDRHESMMAGELKEIHELMTSLNDWMQQSKGRGDTLKYIVGILLGGGGTLIFAVIKGML